MSEDQTSVVWWEEELLDRSRWREIVEPTLARVIAARDRGVFPHSLLLVGPAGLGRELAAAEAAAVLVCPEAQGPWCECSSCVRVRSGVHPDVTLLRPEGKKGIIKIDPIRERVVATVTSRPYEGRRRVWLFDGVEAGRFGPEAANAFLKTLEEPPEHAVFILLAANPTAVLPTIQSRCQQLSLPSAVAVAASQGRGRIPVELSASVETGEEVEEQLDSIRIAMSAALSGEVIELIRLARRLAPSEQGFELLACAAVDMAANEADPGKAEDLVRLADQVLSTRGRARALNLTSERQLLSCLLKWHQGEA